MRKTTRNHLFQGFESNKIGVCLFVFIRGAHNTYLNHTLNLQSYDLFYCSFSTHKIIFHIKSNVWQFTPNATYSPVSYSRIHAVLPAQLGYKKTASSSYYIHRSIVNYRGWRYIPPHLADLLVCLFNPNFRAPCKPPSIALLPSPWRSSSTGW